MKAQEARELGAQIGKLVHIGKIHKAYSSLAPVLGGRTPFRFLDQIGKGIRTVNSIAPAKLDMFYEAISSEKTEGGWVVIASALREDLGQDMPGAFDRCRRYVVAADIWYATDILGERVPGPALMIDFDQALTLMAPWREDTNAWVRRSVGVATHFWAKRSRGDEGRAKQAARLLDFLESMIEEQAMDAVKGVGWGLKTLGRYYPDLATGWLEKQLFEDKRQPRKMMLHKALTYLPNEQRVRFSGGRPG
jgi:hypothetical protein